MTVAVTFNDGDIYKGVVEQHSPTPITMIADSYGDELVGVIAVRWATGEVGMAVSVQENILSSNFLGPFIMRFTVLFL
jgi:hypothetical protein